MLVETHKKGLYDMIWPKSKFLLHIINNPTFVFGQNKLKSSDCGDTNNSLGQHTKAAFDSCQNTN